jgi:uncharacterized membrane protein
MMDEPPVRPLVAAGMTLGMGLGAFFDGIVFHQILQFHNMLSAKYSRDSIVNLEINMFWDGLFHAFAWAVTVLGIAMLWKVARRQDVLLSTSALVGSMLTGVALFNIVEGVIDHHWLHIHHVREIDEHLPWDLGFLAVSAVLGVVGIALVRVAARRGSAVVKTAN